MAKSNYALELLEEELKTVERVSMNAGKVKNSEYFEKLEKKTAARICDLKEAINCLKKHLTVVK